jgi:hypothetical protein
MRQAFFLGTAAALLVAPVHAAPSDIGMTSATRNEVIVVSGTDRRGLKIGDRIFQEQHIRTGANSAAQLLFLDETALTVGPNSALVLDKAVFDPDKKTGELSVRAVSGAFRFVSGSSPSANYTIKTPAGTIGVRGTWFDVAISGDVIRLLVRRGSVEFCNVARQCMRVLAGYEIRANRTRFSAPRKAKHESLDSVIKLWFASGTPGELANLEPGAGPDEGSYWWKVNLGPDFMPQNDRGPGSNFGMTGDGPGAGPPGPGAGPPGVTPGRPPSAGFPPITNPGVGVPRGLQRDTLPPGLANRGPSFLPSGQQKKN